MCGYNLFLYVATSSFAITISYNSIIYKNVDVLHL